VSRIEGIGNLNPQIQQFIRLDGLAGNAFFQGLPFQDLHDDEGLSFMLPHVVDGADVGMIPGRCNSGFSLEPLQGLAVLGKLVFGWIADHIDTRIAVWISIAFQFMGAIFFLQEDSILMMRIAGASFGFGMGGVVPLWGSLIGEVFGRENFGTIMGSMSPCMVPISMTGLPLAAYIFDVTGSYTIAFRMHLVIYVIAALCMACRSQPSYDPP